METAKNLNFGSDEMQMVITALHDVGRRIKEVGETHKPRPLQNSLFKVCSFHHIFVPL